MQPVFWGYILPPNLPSLVCYMLDKAQLGLVFDLDETLVVAHTAGTVDSRIDSCRKARCVGAHGWRHAFVAGHIQPIFMQAVTSWHES